MKNHEWPKPLWLWKSNLNVRLIKVWLDNGHLELKTFCILFVVMGMFCDHCQESSNVEFGCKLISDLRNGTLNMPNKCVEI
jgi:hypothetical protein